MPRADPPVAEKTLQTDRQCELFRSELIQIINLKHPLVKLSKAVNLERLEETFGATYFCVPKVVFSSFVILGTFRFGGSARAESAGGLKLGFSGPTI